MFREPPGILSPVSGSKNLSCASEDLPCPSGACPVHPELCVALASLLAGSDLVSLKLSQVSLCSLPAQPVVSLLWQKTNNQGSSCSRQNWVDEHLRSINTCHHSGSTTTVNAPQKWEQPELRLPCNLKPLLLGWAVPVVVLLNLCSAWLSRCDRVTWISHVCSNDPAFLLDFCPSLQLERKHVWTYKVFNSSPSSSISFWLRDYCYDTWLCHWPWWVCEDL